MSERQKGSTTSQRGEQRRETEAVLRAPVDIYEDKEGITVVADLPGVDKERLAIHVDNDALIVEGRARIDMPEGMEALHADVRSTLYRRSFALSGELDAERIDAGLKDGVLRVRIPKKAEAKPRKIEVRVS